MKIKPTHLLLAAASLFVVGCANTNVRVQDHPIGYWDQHSQWHWETNDQPPPPAPFHSWQEYGDSNPTELPPGYTVTPR